MEEVDILIKKMKDDQELGRMVEYPLESLEKDMVKILSGEDYKHAYAE